MVHKSNFEKISDYVWELPKTYDGRMRYRAHLWQREILDMAFRDQSVEQLINVAMLPGIVKYAMAMPDVHQGYGFPSAALALSGTMRDRFTGGRRLRY